jgi:predicted permease
MNSRRDRIREGYRRLLGLYPRAFRERFEDDLLQAFDDRRAEPRFRGTLGGLQLVLFLLRDFVTSVPMTRTNTNERERRGMVETMGDVMRDLRFSLRMLLKNPMFTVAAVTTLALGIGLNAATFSAVYGLLLSPLPGADEPDELVQIYRAWPGIEYGSVSVPHYQDLRDRTGDVFENVASWYLEPMAVTSDGRAERTFGMVVSANFFQTYGAEPVLGRAFIPDVESRDPGAHPVAVISDGFWQSRFGGDPGVVGRTITLNGHPFEVVGVAPADFSGPVNFAAPPIYVPLMMANVLTPAFNVLEARGSNSMNVVGRLHDGVTVERAREALDVVLAQLAEEYPRFYETQLGHTVVRQRDAGIHPSFGDAQRGMSTVMMVVVALLLLIACVNVANLFLARARDRQREMGIRLSMGAGRGRIIQQLLTESLLFSVVAGAAGLALANVATSLLAGFRPPVDGPWAFNVETNSTVLWFTAAVSLATGFIFGMAPALQSARPETVAAIKGETGGAGRSRASSALVVLQVALSLFLLISSGLFLRSLQAATRIDPGFDEPRSLAMAAVDPGLQGYDEPRGRQFWERIQEEVRALPEVVGVGLVVHAPLGLGTSDRSVAVPGYEFAEGERTSMHYTYISEGYLDAMGIELVDGRGFTRADDENGPRVMIVNQRFAGRFWPGESAVGKTVRTAGEDWEVIGVVETGKYLSLGEDPTAFMYFPDRIMYRSDRVIVARASGDPQLALQRIQDVVRRIDPDLPVYDVRSMEDHMGIALLPARLGGSVLGIFGLLGLTLAAVGIYGVMAYSVSQRKRELGIRVALGADRSSVLKLVLSEGMRLAIIGTVIGLAGALGASRLVAGLLYNASPLDPIAFTAVPLTLLGVAALAVYLPARRAARVDPIGALKSE